MKDFSRGDQINDQEKVTQIECISIVSSVKQTKEIISEKSNDFTSAKHNALCGWRNSARIQFQWITGLYNQALCWFFFFLNLVLVSCQIYMFEV